MSDKQKFLYFPSFSSKASFLKKDIIKIGNLETIRFYDDKYPKGFRHKNFLLTAAAFYKSKTNTREDLGMEDTLVFGDSGGFQVANGTIPWDINIRERIFHWLEENSDIAMNLDIPPRLKYAGKFQECLDISVDNFKYFYENQNGKTKFLNVVQMDNHENSYEKWYNEVRDFEFQGWGVGSTGAQYYNAIYVTALFLREREFEKKHNHYMHFLGSTSPMNFIIYAAIQRGFNEYYPHITVTTDSSTPLMQGVYGNWYHSVNYNKLNWKQCYFGNKGKTKYIETEKLPCALNCPICRNITFNEIANYNLLHEYMIYVGWHNLAVFNKGVNEISDLIYSHKHGGVLEIMFPKDVLSMLHLIDKMFKNPDDAVKIFDKNKKLFQKLSNELERKTDEKVKNNPAIFGTDDENSQATLLDEERTEEVKAILATSTTDEF